MNPPKAAQPIYTLSYEPQLARPATRLAKWISNRSYWVIGLALMLPAMALYQFGPPDWIMRLLPSFGWISRTEHYLLIAALFLPLAVSRLSWRLGLILAVIAGAAYAVELAVENSAITIPYPFRELAWIAPVVGASYWAFNRPYKASTLAWTLFLTATIAFVFPAIDEPVMLMFPVTPLRIGSREIYFGYLLYCSLLAILIWLAIPAAQRLAVSQNRTAKWITLIGAGAGVAWFFLFYNVLLYRLAMRSLPHGRPFDQTIAVLILDKHYSPAAERALWQTLESADWLQKPQDSGLYDYKDECIDVLASHNFTATAERLAALLRRNPSPALACYAAPILAKEHRYEAAPELMRYALLDYGSVYMASAASIKALASMHIPQVALAILHQHAYTQLVVNGVQETPSSLVSPDYERRLTSALGKDVGPKWGDWINYYEKTIDQLPTPLSKDQALETNRVIRAISLYRSIVDNRQKTGHAAAIPAPNFNVPGTAALEQEIQKYKAAADSSATH